MAPKLPLKRPRKAPATKGDGTPVATSSRGNPSGPTPTIVVPRSPHVKYEWFHSNEHIEYFNKLPRPKYLQKYIDFDTFTGNLAALKSMFDVIGLTPFVESDYPTYIDMVDMFYSNFVSDCPESEFVTAVGGKVLRVTADELAKAFKVPNKGEFISNYTLSFEDFFPAICDNPARTNRDRIVYTEIKAPTRLLFLYFSYLMSKQGNFTDFPKTEQNLVYCVKEGVPFNLPQLMISIMRERRKHRPFAMSLTVLFAHFKIKFFGPTLKKTEQCLDAHHLNSLKFIKKGADYFLAHELNDDDDSMDEDETADHPAPADPPAPTEPADTSAHDSDGDDDSDSWRDTVTTRLDGIEEDITTLGHATEQQFRQLNLSLTSRFDATDRSIHDLRSHIDDQFASLRSYFQGMNFPPSSGDS